MARVIATTALVVAAAVFAATGGEGVARSKREASAAAECRVQSVRRDARFVFQPAGSSAEGVVFVRSAGRAPCSLPRHIHLQFVVPRGGQGMRQLHQRLLPGETVVNVLRPHRKVLLRILWENWCRPYLPRALVIEAGDGEPLMRLPVNGAPNCYLPSQVTSLGVTRFFRVVRALG